MAAYSEVFERIEKKYRLTAEQREALMPLLSRFMEPDMYGQTAVTSLYLDNSSNDLICRSLEKPLYKEKIRLRRYGSLDTMRGSNDVYLEIKKKFKGVVYKRRVCLTWDAARAFLAGMPYEQACDAYPLPDEAAAKKSLSPRSVQMSKEIAAFCRAHGPLQDSISTACDRTAYVVRAVPASISLSQAGTVVQTPDEELAKTLAATPTDLRITFDERIRYCDFRQGQGGVDREVPLLPKGESIMEIKMTGSMPLWLSESLSACGIKPTSFSKVGESYLAIEGKSRTRL